MGHSSSAVLPYEVLYRPPQDGEDSAHEHSVQKITRKQVKIDREAEDGTRAAPGADAGEHCYLSRQELEADGSVLHGPTRIRFYENREAAETSSGRRGLGQPPY